MNLKSVGFHVIHIEKFRKTSEKDLPVGYVEVSIIELLKKIKNKDIRKCMIVKGLDAFLKDTEDNAILEARSILNKNIEDILTTGSSIVFVVNCDIEKIPDNPTIHGKPLAMIFPRPHDLGSMEPGYLYYPII